MSQSNAPFNHPPDPDQSKPMDDAPLLWRDPFTGMDEQEDSEVDFLVGSLAEIQMTGPDKTTGSAAIAPRSESATTEDSIPPADPPELADLVSLIQELNQCNSALLDRVSQLEEALEQSHNSRAPIESTEPMPQNLPKAQEQITTLYNQLEFAHQTHQRQQILLETLTDQLQASQERVAQLERETSLLQQRYTEQSQSLAQTEGNCRDLQTRLCRQQRYTLQFKAALEKCLEVPVPQYEGQDLPSAQTAGDYLFLPKAQRIKPWAAQPHTVIGKMPWMNITPGALDHLSAEDCRSQLQANENLHLPTFTLPELQMPPVPSGQSGSTPDQKVSAEDLAEEAIAPSSLNLPSDSPTQFPTDFPSNSSSQPPIDPVADDPALMAHINSIVQPLADLIAEAMLAEPFPVDALQPAIAEPPNVQTAAVSAVNAFASPALASPEVADELMNEPAPAIAPEPTDVPLPSQLPMADAEDALWQDLARLIDVSTEDVVKASLSGDFAAFEAIDFAALEKSAPPPPIEQDPWDLPVISSPATSSPATSSPATSSPATSSPATPAPAAPAPAISAKAEASVQVPEFPPIKAPAPKINHSSAARQPMAVQPPLNPMPQSSVPAFVANSQNSPSPLVYPLRPLKKRQSLAMVELPDFNKQPSSPLSN
ncbi:MAG: hypothetical protein HC781_04420 [Leptolyngbyaceae cyanobacterium CSU_1_4]|nr:hypothetical protein [Leptolyngbyaceae cyanobacterium CSU_1_4]